MTPGTASPGLAAARPSVSVVVRSCNRLPHLCDLLDVLLSQDYPSFEVVVVEQTAEPPADAAARLEDLARDPRVRVLRMGGPIGGARARNVGAEACRGDLIALIDDDDLPAGTDWISRLAANFDDPKCIGVSGRNAQDLAETRPYPDMERAARRCLRFSPLLRIPWTYTRVQRRCAPVDTLAGSNSAIRRDLFARHGGWDEDIRVEDEASFFYRVLRCKAPDEYLAFDPGPTILRRMGVPGGLAKRHINASEYCLRVLDFFVRVIGRYHPWRVALLLPAYGAMSWWWTGDWVLTESHLYTPPVSRAIASAGLLPRIPWLVARAVARRNDRGDARVYPTNPARSSSPGD